MKRTRGRVVHVETLADFDRRIEAGASSLSGWRVVGVDLTERTEVLAQRRLGGATFLGCLLAPGASETLETAGALVLPVLPDIPVDVYRSSLYTADDLYDNARYDRSLDAQAYAWSHAGATGRGRTDDALARTLHDHAIDEALAGWVARRHLVGVMGGHAALRGDGQYAGAARLGHALGATHVVTTGGGPGAMEAANLGGFLSRAPVDAVDAALAQLAAVPSYRPSVDAWLRAALIVRDAASDPADSLAIPTWHYGHEPTNVFATAIAKYFRNATREAILLEVCDAGIVFLPGAAGTIQEVFQDACENYYADESSVASMVLVGATYWTETLPAWPLLRALARGHPMEDRVHLVDSVEEATAVLVRAQATRRR